MGATIWSVATAAPFAFLAAWFWWMYRGEKRYADKLGDTLLHRLTKQGEEEERIGKLAVTVWKGGEWKVWGVFDAYHAASDPDCLVTIGVRDVLEWRDPIADKMAWSARMAEMVAEVDAAKDLRNSTDEAVPS